MSALATILEINWSSTCQIRCCAMWLCHLDVCNISACVCVWLCFVFCLCVCVSVCLCLYEHLFVEHIKVLLCLCKVQTSLVNTMAKLERVKFNPLTHYYHHHCHCQVQPSDREATWDTIFIIMNNYTILIINQCQVQPSDRHGWFLKQHENFARVKKITNVRYEHETQLLCSSSS